MHNAKVLNNSMYTRDGQGVGSGMSVDVGGGRVINRLKLAKRVMAAASGSFLTIEPTHAQVTAFKEAEDGDGFILRLRETAGKPGTARVASPVFPLLAATLTNGVEDGATPVAVSANRVELPLKPYGFTTVRLKFGRP